MIVGFVRFIRRTIARAKFYGQLKTDGRLVVGTGIRVTRGASLITADGVSIGADCTFMAHVEIGPDVMVSSGVAFIGDDHPFQGLDGPITAHPRRSLAHITVHGDSLIGFGAIVLGPVEIGRGAIVAAGAVVTTDLQPDTVYGGIPARPLSPRLRSPSPTASGKGA